MYYDDTEAEHLSDIEDYNEDKFKSYGDWKTKRDLQSKLMSLAKKGYYEGKFELYSDWEKKRYLQFKSMSFDKKDIGKWVIVQNSRENKYIMPTMFLVNRNKTKKFWWSPAPKFAMIFEKESAAKYQAKRYKFNKARAIRISTLMANKEYFESLYEE